MVLLLANLDKHTGQLKTAVERSLASLQGILQATVKAAGDAAFATVRDAKVCILHCSPGWLDWPGHRHHTREVPAQIL